MCMSLLDTCLDLCKGFWHLFIEKYNKASRVMLVACVCVSLPVCLHTCAYFCSKRLFNTCVTPGAVQLKSNTLQESITCWVYWQQTELKWPTEKGRGFFIWRAQQQNDGKYDHRGCTASKCEHLLDALLGSCCENCCQFRFTDIQKMYTQMEIPQRGIMLFVIRGEETWVVWWDNSKKG